MLDKYLWALFYTESLDGLGLPEDGSTIFSFKNSVSFLQDLFSNVSKTNNL